MSPSGNPDGCLGKVHGGCEYACTVCGSVNRARELVGLAEWLVTLDEPEGWEARRTVTLTQIINKARSALAVKDGGPSAGAEDPHREQTPP